MTESRDKVLDLIEKLMRRTKDNANATEAEVEQAVALARGLMRKHNIEMAEILEKEDKTLQPEDVVELEARNAVKLDRHEKTLAHVVCLVCDVRWLFRQRWVKNRNGRYTRRHATVFYGLKSDVEAARMMYCELLIIVKALARGRVGKGSTPQHFAYCDGFSQGLHAKVKQDVRKEPETNDKVKTLVVAKQALIENHERTIGLKTSRSRPMKSEKRFSPEFATGYSDGQDYDLKKPNGNGKVEAAQNERIER